MFKVKATPNKNEYDNFLSSALALHGSVTPKVLKQVFWVFLYALFISWINSYAPEFNVAVGPFEYAGLVMGLILVFRINAGYERWWEARKIWGEIVNKSRNLAIVIVSYSQGQDKQEMAQIIKYIAATPYVIKKYLRQTKDYQDIAHLLDSETEQSLLNAVHPTIQLSTKIAAYLGKLRANGHLNEFSFLKAESQREEIIDCQGACERILTTPMPFVMAIKSRRFILLFLLILPFALVNASVLLSPFITALVAYTLFSLDQIGVELQNPFWESNLSHHPLTNISRRIEEDVLSLLTEQKK